MKRQNIFMTLFLVAIICAFVLPAGCAKKAVMKEEAAVEKEASVEKQAPAQAAQAAPATAEGQKLDEAAMAAAAQADKEASEFMDIRFAFDRFDLKPEARKILDMHAKWLVAHPEFTVRIEGNCDERGTVEYNIALGQRRAASAMKYLVDLGVAKKRLSTISYGKERPLDPGQNEEAWAKNRRDHFSVTRQK
jgi:peptidoglycan-associated lipoprotein